MPTVDGKKFAYTPEGLRAAAEARRGTKPMGSPLAAPTGLPRVPGTKGSMMKKGYNFTRNINGGKLPDLGY